MAGQGAALAMTAAYVLAGELAKAPGRHEEAFSNYETRLRAYIGSKQKGAERFSAAFAPKTPLGLFLRNRARSRLARYRGWQGSRLGDRVNNLQLPDYGWPAPTAAANRTSAA